MFSLLIGFIALALVAALVLAAVFYGGPVLSRYGHAAQVAQTLSEEQQLMGAINLYRTDKAKSPTVITDLVDGNYLKSVPEGWILSGRYLVNQNHPKITDDFCIKYNQKVGINFVPQCNDPAYSGVSVCCQGS